MKKIELLAPAGSLEKACIALMYGADAVYVGGKKFSLRARASNFTLDDIKELCKFAKSLNKKVYVTCNIIPHDSDFDDLEEYLKALEERGVTGIISSSMHIIQTASKVAPLLERHVSTQMSITNSQAIKFWESMGVNRVVLAREDSLEEIKKIAKNTNLELEVFIHGGMCSSYSGRCVLSNHFTSRDANRGGCAHSCRWNYNLYDGRKKLNKHNEYFSVGSKDLMAASFIPALIDLGVASLKIEGRMKSSYYLATVVSSYRRLIDLYYEKHSLTKEELIDIEKEISKAENRLTSCGFFNGITSIDQQLYDMRDEKPTQEYVAYVLENSIDGKVLIEQRNNFKVGDLVEAFGPNLQIVRFKVERIVDAATLEELDVARHPMQQMYLYTDVLLSKHDMIRKVISK